MSLPAAPELHIRDVWASNLDEEIGRISHIVDRYPYVGMDTEYPGVLHHNPPSPGGTKYTSYTTLKANVDDLELLQLGLAFSDAQGNHPHIDGRPCIWQFNFREFHFHPTTHSPAVKSIDLLRRSGIDFHRFRREGVEARRFAQLLMSSGVVLMKDADVLWVTFHSAYDFAYLLKILTGCYLPGTRAEFIHLVKVFFPNFCDIKHVMKFHIELYGGLASLSESLRVERVGMQHQAGSDSLLTLRCFLRMKELDRYCGSLEQHAGVVHGVDDDR